MSQVLAIHQLEEPPSQALGTDTLAPISLKWKLWLQFLKAPQLERFGAGTQTEVSLTAEWSSSPLRRQGAGWMEGQHDGGKHTEPVVWPWRYPCSSGGWGEGDGQAEISLESGPLRSVWSQLVRTKPGPTRGTIAINRIYFVQLLLTYTQPQGLPKWVLGPEGWPLVWCLKSVDRHTQGCGLTAAGPGCPLRGSWVGGRKGEAHNSRPAETPQPGVPRAWDGRG